MNHLNNNNNSTNNQPKYSHLSINERKIIQTYFNQGKSYQFIADKLGRSKSTIHYEIMKHSKSNLPSIHYKRTNTKFKNYNAIKANELAKKNQNFKKISYHNKKFIFYLILLLKIIFL